MKIDTSRLNTIYDQYSNSENRLTHALLHTIGSSDRIFTAFLKKFIGIKPLYTSGIFEISTQKVPFSHGDSALEKVKSVPDAWIVNDKTNLGIAIEVKDKKKNIRLNQLKSHINRIKIYEHQYLVVITPDINKPKKIREIENTEFQSLIPIWKSWGEIYLWLKYLLIKPSKKSKIEFLLKSMLEYLERRREVLGFQGVFFNKGFNLDEAKAILQSEMEELHPFVKKIYKDLVARRPGITTTSMVGVWDCFGNAEGFTNDLHITIVINEDSHNILLVVPDSAKKAWKRLKEIFSEENYQKELISILARYRKVVPHLYLEFRQRHFLYRRIEILDGHLFFDLDVIGKPFLKNGQVAFYAKFFLNETKGIDKPEFINTVKSTLENLKPLYENLKSE